MLKSLIKAMLCFICCLLTLNTSFSRAENLVMLFDKDFKKVSQSKISLVPFSISSVSSDKALLVGHLYYYLVQLVPEYKILKSYITADLIFIAGQFNNGDYIFYGNKALYRYSNSGKKISTLLNRPDITDVLVVSDDKLLITVNYRELVSINSKGTVLWSAKLPISIVLKSSKDTIIALDNSKRLLLYIGLDGKVKKLVKLNVIPEIVKNISGDKYLIVLNGKKDCYIANFNGEQFLLEKKLSNIESIQAVATGNNTIIIVGDATLITDFVSVKEKSK